jgi:hypothetical protein
VGRHDPVFTQTFTTTTVEHISACLLSTLRRASLTWDVAKMILVPYKIVVHRFSTLA